MAAPSIKWREATELGADGVVPLERLASNSFGTTPPARPFLEFDGLAGTPPDSGGEFQTRNCQLVHTSYERPLQLLDPSFSAACQEGNRSANHGK